MKKAGIIACSDGLDSGRKEEIERLAAFLAGRYDEILTADYLYEEDRTYPGNGVRRAEALMKLYRDPEITDIFDVSGGNQGNEVLADLDYEVIRRSNARFWGYSDLTTLANAIYTKTGKKSMLYQARFLVREQGSTQQARFSDWMDRQTENRGKTQVVTETRNPAEAAGTALTNISVDCVQGGPCGGILVGGNIRCFLKLAGTEYFPDLTDKILLLEAWSGQLPQILTYLNQYRQLGAFSKVRGILLGTFSEMEKMQITPEITELVKDIAGPEMPVYRTREIGHGHDAKAAIIGGHYHFG